LKRSLSVHPLTQPEPVLVVVEVRNPAVALAVDEP
jgi:hypothetical protein